MSRALIIIKGDDDRERATRWIAHTPYGMRIEFKAPKRSTDQNARMWACLTDMATQLPWHGLTLTPNDWKLIFLDALKREVRIVPNLDGTGFVQLDRSSSDLSKAEMSQVLEIIIEFGTRHGVKFSDPQPPDQIEARP